MMMTADFENPEIASNGPANRDIPQVIPAVADALDCIESRCIGSNPRGTTLDGSGAAAVSRDVGQANFKWREKRRDAVGLIPYTHFINWPLAKDRCHFH